MAVFTSSNNPSVGGEVCTGSGSTICPSFLERALTTDGGGTFPEGGLDTGLVGKGAVMGSVPDDGGEAGADLMGTVFAARAFIRDGKDAFFASGCAGGGASGAAGAEEEGGMDLVGSGVVCWASAFTNDERDTFFVPCCVGARGEVVTVEEPACPAEEGTAGAVGPIRMVFLARSPSCDGKDI